MKKTKMKFDNRSNTLAILTTPTTGTTQSTVTKSVQLPKCEIIVTAHALPVFPYFVRIVHK